MSKPKHQHFIPKSYLKNFSIEKDGKFFLEGKLRTDDKPKDRLLSIRDICVDKNLYTIPNLKEENKYALEKYYATQIDEIYPEIYELLIDPSITYITPKQRAQIIMTTMSLFFRTPKFLNFNERRLSLILNHAVNNFQDKAGQVKYKFRDFDFDFNIKNIEDVIVNLKIKNKLKFLSEHLDDWNKFIQFKFKAGLMVFEIYEDVDLITSDNPVIMHSIEGNPFNVFDPTNIISLPIDSKHYLTIFPNSEEASLNRIFKGKRDKMFAIGTNYQVDENSEEWILGRPNSITAHIEDQLKYGAYTLDNLQIVEDTKERATDMKQLWEILESTGGVIAHTKVAEKIRELRKKRIHKDDPEMQHFILELAKHGYLTV